jgi:hypothetical protein
LQKYWRRVGRPRSTDETLIIKRLVWQRLKMPDSERPSLRKLARQIGVHHSYLSRLWRKLLHGNVADSFYGSPDVTLANLKEARERRVCIRGQVAHAPHINRVEGNGLPSAGVPSIRAQMPPLHQTPRSGESLARGRVNQLRFPLAGC